METAGHEGYGGTSLNASDERIWVGVDAGKQNHWAVALNAAGETVHSKKLLNDETEIIQLIAAVGGLGDEVRWAVDISGSASALLLALLLAHDQQVVYVPDRTVNRMSGAYRGEGKTDAKDARVIADQARMRQDFTVLTAPQENVATLQLLTSHRADLIAERVRLINRLRDLLASICPALERAFDYSAAKGPVVMLTQYAAPGALRRLGAKRLTTWLQRRNVRGAADVAATALKAAERQHTALPGEKCAAKLIRELAHQLLTLDQRIKDTDRDIRDAFTTDNRAEIIESLPGMGPILGAEFIAIVGDLSRYHDAGRLASHAGLAPVPRDSGRRTGNYHRPKRYNRRLRHIFYLSAQTAMMRPGPSRDYYLKKRAEGMLHTQALLALARRRVDVLWAMLRDNRPFTSSPPITRTA